MMIKKRLFMALLATLIAVPLPGVQAGPLRDRIRERVQERQVHREAGNEGTDSQMGNGNGEMADMGGNALSCAEWSQKVNRLQKRAKGRNPGPTPDVKDVSYGSEALQKLDVFLPKNGGGNGQAPIILMVHGGGWCVGDKGGAQLTENKVSRWVSKGFVFVSANYPMVADGSNALAQANHIARAAAFVQSKAREWGGDPARLILMGHSAGAHLVSLVNADASIRQTNGMAPILGAVSLDAGAIDVVRQMPNVYPSLRVRYREAFGNADAEWIAASPFHKLDRSAAPWLGVCSTTRKDDPCGQARTYAEKSNGLGIKAAVLPEAKNHGAINKELGLPGDYTREVEAFMAALDPVVGRLLK
ncbi:alpha/beta hydrolase [Propionivibrio soli]|uniref:alpha/beta hydrolase n=1 Tax=Propionivibrio soli TaxID=2976531 RepID=UPI0021E9213B|nr:alpha/beta hydrolase [Propionivibrio soli]